MTRDEKHIFLIELIYETHPWDYETFLESKSMYNMEGLQRALLLLEQHEECFEPQKWNKARAIIGLLAATHNKQGHSSQRNVDEYNDQPDPLPTNWSQVLMDGHTKKEVLEIFRSLRIIDSKNKYQLRDNQKSSIMGAIVVMRKQKFILDRISNHKMSLFIQSQIGLQPKRLKTDTNTFDKFEAETSSLLAARRR